jgi:predicted GNAT superfamily acetyltransferase
MLAVLPKYQNQGIGRQLKLAQRDDAIARGIDLIEWTFDPLQLKNAHFNIARLGAVVRRYLVDVYGRTLSPLHGGLPTDRLVAEWWLRSPHVQDRLGGTSQSEMVDCERICLPASIQELCRTETREAERIQRQVRTNFEKAFARGYTVVGFELDQDQGIYRLGVL